MRGVQAFLAAMPGHFWDFPAELLGLAALARGAGACGEERLWKPEGGRPASPRLRGGRPLLYWSLVFPEL